MQKTKNKIIISTQLFFQKSIGQNNARDHTFLLTPQIRPKCFCKAFTLVELIVVIVILAILATIAFLSFSSQSGSARDSTRLSDIASIKKGLEMHNVGSGNYPSPDDSAAFTYSGGILWNQGKLGDKAHRLISKTLSKKVKDPLRDEEYDYSLAANRREYQVAGNLENPTSFGKDFNPFDISDLSPRLSALGGTGANVHISGNYNGVVLKVFTGATYYYVPSPTLFGINPSNLTNIQFNSTFNSGTILLPGIDSFADYKSDQIYSTTGSSLTSPGITSLMAKLQSAYTGSNITAPAVQQIMSANSDALNSIGSGLVKNVLGGTASADATNDGGEVVFNCAANPGYPNAQYSIGTATVADQVWTLTGNTSIGCTYICTGGYSGNDCSIAPYSPPIDGLVGYWDMETLNGTNLKDLSGNNNDGTIIGTTSTGGTGKTGNSRYFNGTGDYINTNIANLYDSLQSGTMMFYLKTSHTASVNVISYSTANNSATCGAMVYGISGTNPYQSWNIDSIGFWGEIKGTNAITDGNWHLIAFVADNSSNTRVYVDGVQISANFTRSGGTSGTAKDFLGDIYNIGANQHLTIGAFRRNNVNYNYFKGNLDELKIYNRALSSQEIQDYYNATK